MSALRLPFWGCSPLWALVFPGVRSPNLQAWMTPESVIPHSDPGAHLCPPIPLGHQGTGSSALRKPFTIYEARQGSLGPRHRGEDPAPLPEELTHRCWGNRLQHLLNTYCLPSPTLGPQRPPFLMFPMCRGILGCPCPGRPAREGREESGCTAPILCISKSPVGSPEPETPHRKQAPKRWGPPAVTLLPSSKSAQAASPRLRPHPSPCLHTLAGGTCGHQGQLLHQLGQALFHLSKRAVQGLLSTWPFLNVYLLLGTEGKSPSGPQKDPPCHLLSSFSVVKASVSLPACSCHPA